MQKLLKKIGVQPGMTVALEGPPIYLADMPTDLHCSGYVLLREIAGAVEALGATFEHWALLDEIHGDVLAQAREAYEQILNETLPPHQTVMEGDLMDEALGIRDQFPRKKLDCAGGNSSLCRLKPTTVPKVWGLEGKSQPQLTNHEGRPTCALLDGAFNLRKQADLSVVVHPQRMDANGGSIDFCEQQAGVVSVLQSRRRAGQKRPELPWQLGVLHVWIDETGTVMRRHCTWIKKGNLWASRV